MEYRTLGGTGTIVSSLCLGTMTFGNESSEEVSHAQLDRFLEQGGTFIDTANVYSRGVSEEIIGRWLANRPDVRDQVVLATKGRFAMGDGHNDVGLSRTNLTKALDASLKRLQVDTVDLYQAHAWDALTPLEETLRFFDDAVRAGKIRYAGVSNFLGWQLQKAAMLTGYLGLTPIVTLQPQYNLLVREIEFELVDVCENENIGILPWSPLAGGWLTGKYQRNQTPTGASRLGDDPQRGMEAYAPRNAQERTWQVIDAVGKIAESRGVSMRGAGRAGVDSGPAGRHLGDPRRSYDRAARRQPDGRRAASFRRRNETAGRRERTDRWRLPVRATGSAAARFRSRTLTAKSSGAMPELFTQLPRYDVVRVQQRLRHLVAGRVGGRQPQRHRQARPLVDDQAEPLPVRQRGKRDRAPGFPTVVRNRCGDSGDRRTAGAGHLVCPQLERAPPPGAVTV
ncbi:aldo/keto reductase [Fodinicola feengrottensis]|nr:aldo/keto reductase [Fodinicola feengrottensis]